MVVITKRKIIRIGNSKAITLLDGWLQGLNLKEGDRVSVIYNSLLLVVPRNTDRTELKQRLAAIIASI